MLVTDFDYDLPAERIAQEPLADRAGARMLHLSRTSGACRDSMFRELPDLLRRDDLLVLNNTRVFPARLFGRRSGVRAQPVSVHNPAAREFLQGQVEVLLTRQVSVEPNEWECLVRPGKKIGVGEKLYFGEPEELQAEVVERSEFGERRIRFQPVTDFFAALDRLGHVPLPPYIDRKYNDPKYNDRKDNDRKDEASDRERYQTVYARERGSVAAPTAGLHFTPEMLARIREHGIDTAEVTLHVGLGTFQPLRVEKVEEHKIHREWYQISEVAALKINQAKESGRRVVAVGTTTVRTLEHAARVDGRIEPHSGDADLFIYPGFQFRVVDALLTNFHLPKSTLLMLVCALGGKDFVMDAYRHAVAAGYRFYSYGDCMFVE